MALTVGFGKVDISPPPGGGEGDLRILGFWYERDKPYGEVRDPLFARAATFSDGERAVCVVSLDLIADNEGIARRSRERLSRELGVPPERALIACTHSHNTPVSGFSDRAPVEAWIAQVVDAVVAAVGRALEGARPAELSLVETAAPGFAENRRARHVGADGPLSAEARERHAFLDETLRMAVARDTGGPFGVLMNFAMHPVATQTQPFITADYPGVLTALLEERLGAALFLNGACGDVNPTRKGALEDAAFLGRGLADAALNALDRGPTRRADGPVRGARRVLDLPRRNVEDAGEIEAEIARLERAAAEAGPVDPDDPDHPWRQLYLARERLAVARMPETIPAEVQVLAVGDWRVVGVPGELAACLGADIRRAGADWVVGYANGYAGYILTEDAGAVGGYETTPARWSPLAAGAGEALRDAATELIGEMGQP